MVGNETGILVRQHRNYWAEKGRGLIDADYSSLYAVKDIISRLGISSGYFRDMFRNEYGVTPKSYLMKVKIRAAKEILLHRSTNVCEIAIEVGFAGRTTFGKAFKKFVGVAPSEFRRAVNDYVIETRK